MWVFAQIMADIQFLLKFVYPYSRRRHVSQALRFHLNPLLQIYEHD